MPTIETATFLHIGGRKEQQDSVGTWSSDDQHTHLIVVADGVGGNVGGAAASQAAIQCAEDYWKKSGEVFKSPKNDLTAIAKAAQEAIRKLHPNERRTPSSTLVALYIDENQKEAHWIHCGDSRLYRIRKGKEITRTRDHSVVQLLLEQGKITEDELSTHPDKSRILKSLGANTFKGVDYDSCRYENRDVFMLCSDGYWESLRPEDKTLPPKPVNMTLTQYAEKIVTEAVKRNGPKSDNTSLAIAYIKPDPLENPNAQPEDSTENTTEQSPINATYEKNSNNPTPTQIILSIILIFEIALCLYIFLT